MVAYPVWCCPLLQSTGVAVVVGDTGTAVSEMASIPIVTQEAVDICVVQGT